MRKGLSYLGSWYFSDYVSKSVGIYSGNKNPHCLNKLTGSLLPAGKTKQNKTPLLFKHLAI